MATIPPDFPEIPPETPIPTGPSPAAVLIKEQGLAEVAIERKFNALRGAPGRPKGPLDSSGVIILPGGFFREFTKGRIFFNQSVKDEAFFVGVTDRKYTQLGGPEGHLGWPVSDDIPDNPREPTNVVTRFQNGAIYWWPDLGAVEQPEVTVRFVGLRCFDTTSGPGADEPYVTVGAVPAIGPPRSEQSQIFEDVDAGEARNDFHEVFRGLPFDLRLSVVMSEHDEGDPHAYKDQMENLVQDLAARAAEALSTVGGPVGVVLSVFVSLTAALAGPTIGEKLSELLGPDDDFIGTFDITLDTKELVRLGLTDDMDTDGLGILHSFATDMFTGDGGRYKAYFSVTLGWPE